LFGKSLPNPLPPEGTRYINLFIILALSSGEWEREVPYKEATHVDLTLHLIGAAVEVVAVSTGNVFVVLRLALRDEQGIYNNWRPMILWLQRCLKTRVPMRMNVNGGDASMDRPEFRQT
jgi:hypothetical protein